MVHRGKHLQEEMAEDEIKPRKNETVCLPNVDKKYKMAASQHENESQHSQLVNTNKSLPHGNFITSRETEGWMRQSDKGKGYKYKSPKEYISNEDQISREQELYFKDTSHKIGALDPDDYCLSDLLSGKRDRALDLLFHTVVLAYQQTAVDDYSSSATKQIPRRFLSDISVPYLRQDLLPAEVKRADKFSFTSELHEFRQRYLFNSEMKDRSETGDAAEQSRNAEKTQLLGSGYIQKNLTEEDMAQSVPYPKNSSLYETGGKYTDVVSEKNFLYPSEDSYFNVIPSEIPLDGHGSQEMFVIEHGHGRSVVVSSTMHGQSRKFEEISHIVCDSKASEDSVAFYDNRMKRSNDTGQSWIDSGGGIPDSPGDQMKLKFKEDLEDFKICGIELHLSEDCNLKRKKSFDLLAGKHKRRDDNHPHEGWRNDPIVPMLKLDAALLRCHPDTSSSIKRSQGEQERADEQNIFSSLTEDSNPTEEHCGEHRPEEDSPTTSQSQLAEDLPTEQDEAKGEQQHVEELSECAPEKTPTSATGNKDSDTSREADHFSGSREECRCEAVSRYRTETGNTCVREEILEGGTVVKQSRNETASVRGHGLNRETVASTNDAASCDEHLKGSVEEDSCSGACALSHDTESAPSECHPSLPVLESSAERSPDPETPTFFRAPVQVSSPGSSEICIAYTDPCNACNEGSITSTHSHHRGVNCENYPSMMVQESVSPRDMAAEGRHTSVIAQEQACYFHVVSPAETDLAPGIAEETVYTFTSWHIQGQPTAQGASCPITQPGFSAAQESSFSQNGMQSEISHQSESVPPPPSMSVQPAATCSSDASSGSAFCPPGPVRLPPVTVQSASSVPPWFSRTTRLDLSLAKHRSFAQLRKRRATFGEDWPTDRSGIDAANMALSGFFVTGQGREVRCFYCGLDLPHLTPAHNIWDEHVRLSPDCQYLNLVMGREFVLETLHQLHKD